MDASQLQIRIDYGVPRGEDIVFPGSALSLVLAHADAVARTGLPQERLSHGNMIPMILPVAQAGDERWEKIPAELLGLPLLWLPDRLRLRRILLVTTDGRNLADQELFVHPDGSVRDEHGALAATADEVSEQSIVESVDQRNLRISVEMTQSGLFTPEGGWADVLAAHGLRVDDEDSRARLTAWRAGGADSTLDGMNLDVWLEPLREDEPAWSSTFCDELYPVMRRASWAAHADDLIDMVISDFQEPDESGEAPGVAEQLRTRVRTGASLAVELFSDCDRADLPELIDVEDASLSAPALYRHLADGVRGRLLAELYEISEHYGQDLLTMREIVGAGQDETELDDDEQ